MREGCVHGRFQLLHLEHLRYIRLALEKVDFLHIGVTATSGLGGIRGSHRLGDSANPLTYYERTEMIRSVLQGAGVGSDRYVTTPFPVENPSILPAFVPTHVPCYTTVRESWNLEKIALLREQGYRVEVLLVDYDKRISSTLIRASIAAGDVSWHHMVPPETRDLADQWDIASRVQGDENPGR